MKKTTATLSLIAMTPIVHDGQQIAIGGAFEVDETQAQPLLDIGAATLAADEPAAEAGGASDTDAGAKPADRVKRK